jgi:cell division protein FtsB
MGRKIVQGLLVFVTVVLVVDALVGDRGFLETMRAREASRLEAGRLANLRQENARLRDEKRRLTEDPLTIESEARRQLGLIRPGEVLFILKDIRPTDPARAGHQR